MKTLQELNRNFRPENGNDKGKSKLEESAMEIFQSEEQKEKTLVKKNEQSLRNLQYNIKSHRYVYMDIHMYIYIHICYVCS